jgi:hypothetical protein
MLSRSRCLRMRNPEFTMFGIVQLAYRYHGKPRHLGKTKVLGRTPCKQFAIVGPEDVCRLKAGDILCAGQILDSRFGSVMHEFPEELDLELSQIVDEYSVINTIAIGLALSWVAQSTFPIFVAACIGLRPKPDRRSPNVP